ncbi:hypothetical protein F2Q70_00025915 [Brassica cretica]|uniref:Uncharacterized protein n=1 Tax=Brassica cretica TaxID=69181 RepID=A0A8S9LB60_BRACR|nr:hypothetical protein F2Q70_00025915 [Brassica cretica]
MSTSVCRSMGVAACRAVLTLSGLEGCIIDRCSGDPIDQFGVGTVDRCSWSGVDRHQCDPPKLIRLSTSKSPSCSFSSFTTCQKSSPMMAFTWCFITSSSTLIVKAPCLLTTSHV